MRNEDNTFDLAIIIVSYNCAPLLIKCLHSINNSISQLRYETICVDNHSSDNTVIEIPEKYPAVRLLANDHNVGFAAANNQGARTADAKYLLFLNPDTLILNKAIETAMSFIKARPDVGLVGAKLLNTDGTLQPSCSSFPSLWYYFLESTFLYHLYGKTKLVEKGRPITYRYDRPLLTDVIKGAFLLVRRDVFLELDGFDEEFFMYSEEDDFCYRMHKSGWKAILLPQVEVIHYGGQSSKPQWNTMFVEMHKSKLIFFKKHHGKLKTCFAAVILFLGVATRLPLWALAGLISSPGYKGRTLILTKLKNYATAFGWYARLRFRHIIFP